MKPWPAIKALVWTILQYLKFVKILKNIENLYKEFGDNLINEQHYNLIESKFRKSSFDKALKDNEKEYQKQLSFSIVCAIIEYIED